MSTDTGRRVGETRRGRTIRSRRPSVWRSLATSVPLIASAGTALVLGSLFSAGVSPFVVASTLPAAAASSVPSGQPTELHLSVALPAAFIGHRYSGAVSGSAAGIVGCYRFIAAGLPPGLKIDPVETCLAHSADLIATSITGIPTKTAKPLFTSRVTVTAYAIGVPDSPRRPTAAGSATGQLVLSPPTAAPKVADSYANLALLAISCPQTGVCWVIGTSSNPSSPASGTPPPSGYAPRRVLIPLPGSKDHLQVIAGGTFIAQLMTSNPLVLHVVRTGIPGHLTSLACADAASCVAAGSGTTGRPSVLVMRGGGQIWSYAVPAIGSPLSTGNVTSVACPTTSSCLVVGTETVSPNSGVGFSDAVATGPTATPLVAPTLLTGMSHGLSGVACASASYCVAVGGRWATTATTGSSQILLSRDSGRSWQRDQVVAKNPATVQVARQPYVPTVDGPVPFGGLNSVGCAPGAPSCAVLWGFWSMLANTTDGVHWLPGTITQTPFGLEGATPSVAGGPGGATVGGPQPSISCPVTGRCFVAASDTTFCFGGHGICDYAGVLANLPGNAGWRWGVVGLGPPGTLGPSLRSISCPSLTSCVAVGSWTPYAPTGWSASFPLTLTPQAPLSPFYLPPSSGPSLLTQSTIGAILGGISLFFGLPIVAESATVLALVSVLAGVAGVILGLPACVKGDWLGCASTVLGFLGIWGYSLGWGSLILGGLDPSDPTRRRWHLPAWMQDPMYPPPEVPE